MVYRRLFGFPEWRLRDPFGELERMRRQMDRLFGTLETGLFQRAKTGVFPLINLTEDKDNYYIRAELPGVTSDKLDIQGTGKNIAISGERKIPVENQSAKYHRREREAGKFSRMIDLPGEIDTDKVEARLVDGVLTVTAQKAVVTKPRQIVVQ